MSQSSAPPLGPEPGVRPGPGSDADPASGTAHAKAILVGEHSVVYGRPAVALPVGQLRVTARIRRIDGPPSLRNDGASLPIDRLPERFASIGVAARAALDFFGLSGEGVEIDVVNEIPAGAGLGASAAVAHAVVEALRAHAEAELSEAERFELVQTAERTAHGNPSGLDALATRTGLPLLFRSRRGTPLPPAAPLWFAIADTGVRSSTKQAVAHVARFVEERPRRAQELLDRLGELALQAAGQLRAARTAELGARMDEAQTALDELGVGHPMIERLTAAARAAGALGAKLTGAGRGGCVLALAGDEARARELLTAMRAAGAVSGELVRIGQGPAGAGA